MTIFLIVILVIALGVLGYLYKLQIDKCDYYKRLHQFSNVIPRRQYISLLSWLQSKRGRLSVLSKMELINRWYSILMTMPKEYSIALDDIPNKVDLNNNLSQTDWKRMLMDLLQELYESKDLDLDSISDASFYIFNIVFK